MRSALRISRALVVTLLMFVCATGARAQWIPNAATNNAVCNATGNQTQPQMCSDGNGGAIITWLDARSASEVYIQRLDASGNALWTPNGVRVTTGTVGQLAIASDGDAGAIVVWRDGRNSQLHLYAERITSAGVTAAGWNSNGTPVCTIPGATLANPKAISDGANGVIAVWQDSRPSPNAGIYAMRLDGNGAIPSGWTANGNPICVSTTAQAYPYIVTDGAGGGVIAWQWDVTNADVYASRILSNGSIASGWPANGLAVCTAANFQEEVRLASDGAGGGLITWHDYRSSDLNIYAIRITAAGGVASGWTSGGTAVCTVSGLQRVPKIIHDGSQGAYVFWEDQRPVTNTLIYAQRLTSSGAVASGSWVANGIALAPASLYASTPIVTADSSGGAIIAWQDSRNAPTAPDIYAQRIDSSGAVVSPWPASGSAIATASSFPFTPQIESGNSDSAIIAWTDYRAGDGDIYASRVLADGTLPVTVSRFELD